MPQHSAIARENGADLAGASGPFRPAEPFYPGLESMLSQSVDHRESATLKTFALMRDRLLALSEIEAIFEQDGLLFAGSYHSGYSRLAFQTRCTSAKDGSTRDFAIKLGSSHFSEFTMSLDDINAETQLSHRLAALPKYATNFANVHYGNLLEIPRPILQQIHPGLAEWFDSQDASVIRPTLAIQICEWIDGPTIDRAMTHRMLTPEQNRALAEKVIEIIVGSWYATLHGGAGILYDTDVNDIVLAQGIGAEPNLSIDRPVFIDADGGKKSGNIDKLIEAIDLFVKMFAVDREIAALCGIKAIEVAQSRLNQHDLGTLCQSMRSYI